MTRRRAFIASTGTALTAALAGCGFILGTEPAEFEASASTVGDSVLEETGYEFVEESESEVEREVSAGDQTRTIIATNVQAKYEKSVGLEQLGEVPAAKFTSLTTPQAEILGETFNPVEELSATDLAERGLDQYEGFDDAEKQSEGEVEINGETTTQSKFSAEATFDGSPLDIFLHVSEAVELDDDFVVTFGTYPQVTPAEEENVLAMMEAVESA